MNTFYRVVGSVACLDECDKPTGDEWIEYISDNFDDYESAKSHLIAEKKTQEYDFLRINEVTVKTV